jgi:hypothetical protein
MQYSKIILTCLLCGLFTAAFAQTDKNAVPDYQKNYNPERIAAAETAMWRAYYNKDRITGKLKLAMLLVELLKEQFKLQPDEAAQIAYLLTSSAMLFKKGKYDEALPPLKSAYENIKKYTTLNFDPEKVAKADLKWWIARRTPERKKPEVIGQYITHLYELIYGYSHQGFTEAGLRRAQAVYLRDTGGEKADWKKIEKLLVQSYQALQRGFEKRPEPQKH